MSNVQITQNSAFSSESNTFHSPFPSPPLPSPSLSLPSYLFSLPFPSPPLPSFVDSSSNSSLSFPSLKRLVSLSSHSLSSIHGLRDRHVALLVIPNSLHFPVISLAVLSLGAILSPANPLLTRSEFQSQIEDSSPFLIITTKDLAPKLDNLISKPLVFIEDFMENLVINSNLNRTAEIDSRVMIQPSDPATLMYSSGTTGKSKGVISTHANLISMTQALRHVWLNSRTGTSTGTSSSTGTKDVYACVLPLFHMFGFSVFIMGVISTGSTAVIVPGRFVPDKLMEAVRKYGITRVPVVPPMLVMMARSEGQLAVKGKNVNKYFGTLKEVISSGAPLRKENVENFARFFPNVRLSQCYGLTETSGPVTLCDGLRRKLEISIGRLIPNLKAKILDVSSGKSLGPNNLGELCLNGPPVMQGYLNNEEASCNAIDKEGWLKTGDLCYIDSNGCIYIVDRIKELIKYKAYQVAPAELEELLASHSDIQDVAVTSYPDEEAGEIPMACVVRKKGSKIREADIISFLENKVAPYKKIRKVTFLDSIPRSASGKILRRLLKSRISDQNKIELQPRL